MTPRTFVLLQAFSLAGCVGINPAFDEDEPGRIDRTTGTSDEGGVTTQSTDASAPDVGVTTGSSWFETTGDGLETDTLGASDTAGPSDPCLAQGLARCEAEGQADCVDLARDVRHCGECFAACATLGSDACVDGQCVCPQGNWWQMCDGGCAFTRDDSEACGNGCTNCLEELGPEGYCEQGQCRLPDSPPHPSPPGDDDD